MKTSLEILNEVHEVGKSHPAIYSSAIDDRILVGAIKELEDRIKRIQESKQDNPLVAEQQVPAQELTRGKLQQKMYILLTAACEKEAEIALRIHQFLSSLESSLE
jgi:hypothetical protein